MIKDSGERTKFGTGAVRDMHVGKGIPTHSFLDSAARHIAKYMDGWKDEPHLRAAAWNLLWAIQMEIKHPELVDTPWREEDKDGETDTPAQQRD